MNSAQTRVPSIVTGILLPASRRPAKTPTEGTPSSPAVGRLLEGHRPSPFTPGRMSFSFLSVFEQPHREFVVPIDPDFTARIREYEPSVVRTVPGPERRGKHLL